MKKLLFMLILAFIFGSGLHAQQPLNFAPVGAEWYYNRFSYPSHFFYTRYRCVGIDTINNLECHIIEKYNKYDCGGNIIDSISFQYLFVDNLQIYEVENDNTFLLYDFSKQVGEYWIMPKYNDTIFVNDIEDLVLANGDTAKLFSVTNALSEYWYSVHIIDRFGGEWGLFPNPIYTGCSYGDIRCYSEDNEILFNNNWDRPCDTAHFYTIISESENQNIKIPNPVSDHITILTSNNKIPIKSIEIYTMTGQFILSVLHPSGDNITIPFSQYHNGMYIMKLLFQDQSCKTYKIIKL